MKKESGVRSQESGGKKEEKGKRRKEKVFLPRSYPDMILQHISGKW
ncbi:MULTISPECIES: hypothetical protein [Okeania]|nr:MULTISPECIES: hypothetical protein [Okeania]NET21417.1 hypothetical protein [Okeania sp. SIO1H5]NET77245.1 hypothetical protein [Okeania sp. SIO1F9]NET93919.1 hypothetical protein [Okeania sp. SIO1H2]